MQDIVTLLIGLNNNVLVPAPIYYGLTGILITVALLSLGYFKYTPSAKFKYAKAMYFSAVGSLFFAIFINRLLSYPPKISFSAFLYLISYVLFTGYILYAGAHRQPRRK